MAMNNIIILTDKMIIDNVTKYCLENGIRYDTYKRDAGYVSDSITIYDNNDHFTQIEESVSLDRDLWEKSELRLIDEYGSTRFIFNAQFKNPEIIERLINSFSSFAHMALDNDHGRIISASQFLRMSLADRRKFLMTDWLGDSLDV